MKRSTATARNPPSDDDHADVRATFAAAATGAARRFRQDQDRLVAQGVVDKAGRLLKARLALKKPAATTDTRRW